MPTNFLSTLCGVLFAACGAGAVAGPGVTVLRSFNNVDGQYPIGRLLYGSDGRIYGTTYGGGAAGLGTAFAVSKDRSFALLHSFNGLDGNSLNSGLIQLANGDLLGSTSFFAGGAGDIQLDAAGLVLRRLRVQQFRWFGVHDGERRWWLRDAAPLL